MRGWILGIWILGLWLSFIFGFFTAGLLKIGKDADNRIEKWRKNEKSIS